MLQAERPTTRYHPGCAPISDGRIHDWIVIEPKLISDRTKWDIEDLLLDTAIPEEFNYEADIKFLYYSDNRLVGLIAYNMGTIARMPIPVFIHVILRSEFQRTKAAYKFLLGTFKELSKKYSMIVAHIPNDREYMIRLAEKVGFISYSINKDSKYYYKDLTKGE